MINLLACALLLAPTPAARPVAPAQAPRRATVEGQLRSAGLRTPVADAHVFATARRGAAWTREAITGSDGRFVLTDLPSRDFLLTIVAVDHERLVQPTGAAYWTGRRPPVIYLQSSGAGRYRTIVAATGDRHPSTYSARLSPQEIARLPGSQGDPLRALQNLPGVARIPGGLGLLVMRGATPNQSQVFYGEHPIPRAFHFPGLASVVPGVALAGIQYTPGNFDSSYGNAVGGIVTMTPRSGRRDGVHGMAKLDLTSAGTALEGRLGRGSFLIAGQRGYLDLILKPLSRRSGFPLPHYYDYQVIFEHPIGHNATATVRFIGASDSVRFPKNSYGSDFELSSAFYRADLSLRKRVGNWDLLLAPAVRFDRARLSESQFGTARKSDTVGLLRAEASARPSRRLRITVGADTQIDGYSSFRSENHGIHNPTTYLSDRGLQTRSGLYVTPELTLRRLTVSPGVRVNMFTSQGQAFAVDPRLILRWTPHARVALSAGAGQYSQPSQRELQLGASGLLLSGLPGVPILPAGSVGGGFAVLPSAVNYLDAPLGFGPTGPVGVTQAAQVSGGVHVDILASLGLDTTVFYRRVRDGVPPPPRGSDLPIDDTGSITFGVEALLRKQLTRRLQGWIAYTWMRSVQGTMTGESLTRRVTADFDQRHNLIVVLSVLLPRRWELGGRFRVVSGLPYSPFLIGIHNADSLPENGRPDAYFIAGPHNSARLPTFHQLDLRVDRTWVLKRSIVGAYLDVQNVYNRQNPDSVIANSSFNGVTATAGLPILPVFGVRVEY